MKKKLLFYLHFFLLIFCSLAQANIIQSKGTGINGNWNVADTWVGGIAPGTGDTAQIADGDTVTTFPSVYIEIDRLVLMGSSSLLSLGASSSINVSHDVVNNGSILLNNSSFIWVYENLTNNGSFKRNGVNTTLSVGFGAAGHYSINGSGSIGSSGNPLGDFNCYDSVTIAMTDSIYTVNLNVLNGKITNTKKIVLGNGSSASIRLGYSPAYPDPVLDTFPAYTCPPEGISIRYYGRQGDFSTGYEIPPSRIINSFRIDALINPSNPSANITIDGGDLTVTTNLFLAANSGNNRRLILGNNNFYCSNIFGGSKLTAYVVTNGTGALKRPANPGTTVEFPIGSSATSYDPVSLTFTDASALDTFGVRVSGPDFTNMPFDITKTVKREWNVSESTHGNDTADVSLTYDNVAPVGTNYDPMDPVVVGHYTGGHWTEKMANISNTSFGYTISATGFTSFSPFGVGNVNSLPLQLLSFFAQKKQNDIQLNWVVTNEINNKKFEIERSTNGISFSSIATIGARNNGSHVENYSYTDQQPIGNILYYRLKQTDVNGTYSYSPIVAVKMDSKQSYIIYPNPVKDRVQIRQSVITNELSHIVIYDNKGNKVYQNNLNINSGIGSIELSKLPAGNYIMKIGNGSELYSTPFIKQ